jgi:bacteriorhodopsin
MSNFFSTPFHTASSRLTEVAFGASLFAQFSAEQKDTDSRQIKEIRKLEKSIFAVATGIYFLNNNQTDFKDIQKLRYLDWIITTPMLLRTLHLLAEEKGFSGSFVPALGFNIAMIIFGYLYEIEASASRRKLYLILGFVGLVGVLKYNRDWGNYLKAQGSNVDDLLKFFYIGWTFYGVNALTPNEELRQTGFNIADLFNKAIYSLVLEDVIKNKL